VLVGQDPLTSEIEIKELLVEADSKDRGVEARPVACVQMVKLRGANLLKFGGGEKGVKDRLATMVQWLCFGYCTQEQKIPLAPTFLTGGGVEGLLGPWRATSVVVSAFSSTVSAMADRLRTHEAEK
jgi:hypothetical protein